MPLMGHACFKGTHLFSVVGLVLIAGRIVLLTFMPLEEPPLVAEVQAVLVTNRSQKILGRSMILHDI